MSQPHPYPNPHPNLQASQSEVGSAGASAGDDPEIVLYSYLLSPFAAKVHCFLQYEGLRFETVFVDPRRVREELPLGRQIPVLRIGEELRNDSTPIGLWIDERFPERPPLLPRDPAARAAVLEVDSRVTQRLITLAFRTMLADGEPLLARIRNRRRGARALHATVPGGLPLALRILYPLIVSRPGFIRRQLALAEPSRPLPELQAVVRAEMWEQLAGGPFLGGQSEPSLADLAAHPQLALPYRAGYVGAEHFLEDAVLVEWLERVDGLLDATRPLLPAALVERTLPWESGFSAGRGPSERVGGGNG